MSKVNLLYTIYVLTQLLLSVHTLQGSEKHNLSDDFSNQSDIQLLWKQAEVMCGPQSLWQIAHVYGRKESLNTVATMAGTHLQYGTTVKGMVEAAEKMGLQATVMKTNVNALSQDQRVAILLLTKRTINHYVILDKIENDSVRLLDGIKFIDLSIKELKSIWDGYTIFIGNKGHHRTDHFQRCFARCLQISGLLILLVVTTYAIKSTYSYLSNRKQ